MTIEFQPFVGARPFSEGDRRIFFGREAETRNLLSLIIAHKMVLVYSPSGAGKSSLLNAALIPMLREESFEVLPVARVKLEKEGSEILPVARVSEEDQTIKKRDIKNIYVFNTLKYWNDNKYNNEQLAEMSIPTFLKEREHIKDEDGFPSPRAIIFDQFEELFTWYPDRWEDRKFFFEQVGKALEDDPPLRAVFVMREEYIARLDHYVHFLPEKLRIRFHIDRLRKEGALQAIKDPLRPMYLFNWNNIPGNDNEKLIEYLKQIFGIDWIKIPEIKKTDDERTIKVYVEDKSCLLKFNNEKTKLNLEIYDGTAFELIARQENGGLNIYHPLPSFDNNVAEKLVDDLLKIWVEAEGPGPSPKEAVTGEFIEALQLQVVCRGLLQQFLRNPRIITFEDLDRYGNIDEALIKFYDNVVSTIAKKAYTLDEGHLRDWFEDQLITESGTRGTVFKGAKNTGNIPNSIIEILDKECHIIRADWRAGAHWYELTHDKFIEPIKTSNRKYRSKTKDSDAEKKENARRMAKEAIDAAENAWANQNYNETINYYNKALVGYQEIEDPLGEKITLFNLGQVYSETKNYKEAINIYQKVIALDPRFAQAYNNYAYLLDELGNTEAEKCYKKAIEIDPKLAEAYYNYALLLVELNRKDDAKVQYEKIHELEEICIEKSLIVASGFRARELTDACGIQTYKDYHILESSNEDFEFNIDRCLSLNLTMRAEKDTNTSLLLMVHDKTPYDHVSRFVVIGKTKGGDSGIYALVKNHFTIKDDGQWHDYTYNLKILKEYYPDADTIRMIQFYSYRECDGISHTFNIRRLLIK